MITREEFEELGLTTYIDLFKQEELTCGKSIEKHVEYLFITTTDNKRKIENWDYIMRSEQKSWSILYSLEEGLLEVWWCRFCRFTGYITSIEDFKKLIGWLRIDNKIK